MKQASVTLAAIFIGFFASCEKRQATPHRGNPSSSDADKEQALVAEKENLRVDLQKLAARRVELENEIRGMKTQMAEWTENLRFTDAERARMLEEGYWLKRRWEKELEGLHGEPSRPVSELYSELARKADLLLQENAELKHELRGTGN